MLLSLVKITIQKWPDNEVWGCEAGWDKKPLGSQSNAPYSPGLAMSGKCTHVVLEPRLKKAGGGGRRAAARRENEGTSGFAPDVVEGTSLQYFPPQMHLTTKWYLH
jgi:hypothetical protein